jgi:aspartyl-tRNA(Asn)/glutamyl-tRNA(Gln) amidotransferase subunit A
MHQLTAHELSEKLVKKEISSTELVNAIYTRIKQVEPQVKAYITLTQDWALKIAKEIDAKRSKGLPLPPLAGIPIGIKDNMCTQGILTTCASKILNNYIPPYNSTVVEKVLAAGMVPIGKLNMDEFAMGSSTENSAIAVTRNPWNLKTVPGGSSGGSAASVAADETILALGSDTGGSIRQPASFCGVVGLKPTYGRVSRYGLVAFASSLDQIGPLTKDVTDAALLMNVISGFDPKDSTSAPQDKYPVPDYTKALTANIKGLKIGLIKDLLGKGIEEGTKKAIEEAVKVFEKLGATVEEVSLPSFEHALACYYLIATAEASSNLARYDAVKYGQRTKGAQDLLSMYYESRREGFGAEVKRRIMLGT